MQLTEFIHCFLHVYDSRVLDSQSEGSFSLSLQLLTVCSSFSKHESLRNFPASGGMSTCDRIVHSLFSQPSFLR